MQIIILFKWYKKNSGWEAYLLNLWAQIEGEDFNSETKFWI